MWAELGESPLIPPNFVVSPMSRRGHLASEMGLFYSLPFHSVVKCPNLSGGLYHGNVTQYSFTRHQSTSDYH